MKIYRVSRIRVMALVAGLVISLSGVSANEPLTYRQRMAFKQDVVLESMYKAKEWQEAQHEGPVPTNWLTGTLYTGVFACYEATGKTEFLDAARDWCIAAEWKCGERRPMHADDICSAQTFLDVYSHDKEPMQIKHIRDLVDKYYFEVDSIPKSLIGHANWPEDSRVFNGRNLWWWCDALYMAPPVFARLGAHTGEQKYYDQMHSLYWDATDYLYNTEENLFYRDNAYFNELSPNGKKTFWSRGNGWVVGGLVRTLDYLSEEDPYREKYLNLFREMMLSLAGHQMENGLWSSSILDTEWLPQPESSGSAFYTFALAAGINRGWLEPRIYLPVLVKAWEGLVSCLREDGKLEWAQLVDHTSRRVRHEDHKNYAQGAFLLAAAEVYKMNLDAEKYYSITGDRRIVTISEEGAWTWYNDERAIFHDQHLVVGNVNNEGQSAMSLYLLPGRNHPHRLESFPLSTWTEKDDHNNPAFLSLGRDSLLAVYAGHGTQKEFNTRIIFGNYKMTPEQTVAHSNGVTYSNLYKLEDENGRIYNFFRGEGWNPNMVFSDDRAKTWSDPLMIFLSGDNSTRPYVKYCSDNKGRIDLFYTDGHPRNEPENSIYHVYYEKGKFYNSKGKKIRSLEDISENPLLPDEGTLIYDGSGPDGRGWVHDLEMAKNGELAGVFITSPDGDEGMDLRYNYARFNPKKKKWISREIAFAGPHLYVPENHYAGGISLDPENINVVYLSSLLNPVSGEPNGTGHYQIYKGETTDGGETWTYEQLSFDVKNDNLRPFVPRNRPGDIEECVIWFRGVYTTYKDFETEVVGILPGFEKAAEFHPDRK